MIYIHMYDMHSSQKEGSTFMDKDPYSVLGLTRDASDAEVKKTFRELARKYHPDSEFGDADKMAEVNEAYDTIMNRVEDLDESSLIEDTVGNDEKADTEEDDHSFGAMFARVFGEFGCFASNFEQINGGPPQESSKMHKAYTEIRDMDLDEAINTLESIGESNRHGRWYYYYSMTDALLGEHEEALRFAGIAAQDAPNNVEIQDYYQQLTGVIKDWIKKHPEDGPEVLFTRKRTIQFTIGLAIFLILAFFIWARTGVINVPGITP